MYLCWSLHTARFNALVVTRGRRPDYRTSGGYMKWRGISELLPGRSPIACRLRYQNYLETPHEWNEERKNQLAWLYER